MLPVCSSGSLNFVTEYTYNELDKLTQVAQKGTGGAGTQQTRTFTYDSLGRLLEADNPEDTGTNDYISYAYDDNGNLLRKVDARGVAKCFYSSPACSGTGTPGSNGYDGLNRPVVVTYSDSTPTERFCYDGKVFDTASNACVTPGSAIPYSAGRLTSQGAAGVSATTYSSFDPLGRVLASQQKTYDGSAYKTYSFAYSYNLDGSLATQTYPSGRVVEYTYDGSGRPYSVQEPSSGPSYLNSVAYTAAGSIDNLQLGNSLIEQTCYNDLLQPVARRLGDATSTNCAVQTSTDLLHLGFGYGAAADNNGNMLEQTIWAPDNGSGSPWTVTQDYTYDAVNRLATSAEKLGGATQWSRTYSYDHFGNRWISGSSHQLHGATPDAQSDIDAATNRLSDTNTGAVYDLAGNLTYHPFLTENGSMAYDANNKMTAFTKTGVSVGTAYDAAGRRVRKVHNSETTIWVYDAMGKLAAEYTTKTQTDEATYFRTTDHLGSTRLTTDEVGDVVARRDYFPFGERIDSTLSGRGSVLDGTLVSFNSSPGMRQEFTGQQRDDETGLDYFWERCFCSELARFFSLDPQNAGASVRDPQSWNAFAYVGNSPLSYVDDTGLRRATVYTTVTVIAPPPPDTILIGVTPPSILRRTMRQRPEPWDLAGDVDQNGNTLIWNRKQTFDDVSDFLTGIQADLATFLSGGGSALAGSPCAGVMTGLGTTFTGFSSEISSVKISDGLGLDASFTPAWVSFPFGSSDFDAAISRPWMMMSHRFANSNKRRGPTAAASLVAGEFWIDPRKIDSSDRIGSAALIMHETMHTVGYDDPQLAAILGIPYEPNNTRSISEAIAKQCLQGTGF